jgi:hypothetical protein
MAKKPEPYKPRGGGKLGDPIMYNKGKQWDDKAATDSYYNKQLDKQNKIVEKTPGYFPLDFNLGPKDKNGEYAIDRESTKLARMGTLAPGKKAYQKQWIAKGAMANEAAVKAKALKDAAAKRKNK